MCMTEILPRYGDIAYQAYDTCVNTDRKASAAQGRPVRWSIASDLPVRSPTKAADRTRRIPRLLVSPVPSRTVLGNVAVTTPRDGRFSEGRRLHEDL